MQEFGSKPSESRSGIALKLQNLPGVSLEQAELTSGDYLIGPGVAVERKAANDFVISLMEGRLFDQLARMAIDTLVLVVANNRLAKAMLAAGVPR